MTSSWRLGLVLILFGSYAAHAEARRIRPHVMPTPGNKMFRFLEAPVSPPRGARAEHDAADRSGATIAALTGGDRLVVDGDSGQLVRVDRRGTALARLNIGPDASQFALDRARHLAYVADRTGDRVVVVSTRTGLERVRSFATPAEPFGLALAPGGDTLLVTTVADHRLVALDTTQGKTLWQVELERDPRGVAVSPDGASAVVTFVSTGSVARLDLTRSRPAASYQPLNQMSVSANQGIVGAQIKGVQGKQQVVVQPAAAASGRSFARSAFAATYLAPGLSVVAYQDSTPRQMTMGSENVSVYGGGGSGRFPVEHRVAFMRDKNDGPGVARAEIGVHQPRALRYDARGDTLLVAGYGSDDIVAIADASKPSAHQAWRIPISGCGPNGVDVTDDGEVIAFCSLSRKVATITPPRDGKSHSVKMGVQVTRSRFSAKAIAGRALFRKGNDASLSGQGALACESCHPEGRADGLSWRIGGMSLQTPLLAGRIMGTHPFKWDGGDKDIDTSLRHTVKRLGGTGITSKQAEYIAAYLAELPAPRAPTVTDARAVARGKKLFRSKSVGCVSCHSGKLLTDGERYPLAEDIEDVDTPSLIGLAASAPYYHDGSAADLRAVLYENGSIHGMGDVSSLTESQIDDLVAYLETL